MFYEGKTRFTWCQNLEDAKGKMWYYPYDLCLAVGILKCLLVLCVCLCAHVLHGYEKNKAMRKKNMKKIAIFSTPGKDSHWLFGCIQKAKIFIALLAKATFLHSGAVQRKSTKNLHITVPEILFEQLYWLGLTPLDFFFPLFEKVHLTAAELNQLRWTFHENFLRYFFSSKLWNFKEHF